MCQLGTSDIFLSLSPSFSWKSIVGLQKMRESRVEYLKMLYLFGRKSLNNGIELK